MNFLRWAPFPQAAVRTYRVYRSLVGFVAPLVAPATLAGRTLTLRLNDTASQTVTFDSGPDDAVSQINAVLVGGRAYNATVDATTFVLRSVLREAPGKVEILGGTALSLLGLTARVITEKSEDALLVEVDALDDPALVVTFDDPDGVAEDWYAVTTVGALGEESYKTAYLQATSTTGKICVIEGIVADLQGVRVPDCEVTATLQNAPLSPATGAHVTLTPIATRTREDGRFSIALLQGAQVLLEIPAISYSANVEVPAQAYVFITDLGTSTDYRLPVDFK
jgi:hypothetical protein